MGGGPEGGGGGGGGGVGHNCFTSIYPCMAF